MYYPGDYQSLVGDVNKRFTEIIARKNPSLIDAAIHLHQSGEIPPNTYVLDLDAHRSNARIISKHAKQNDLSLYYMSKQIGRNPVVCKAVLDEGFGGMVAVESQEAKSLHRHHLQLGHVGHLVQIPVHDIDYVLSMNPEVWTVYSYENAKMISDRAQKIGRVQDILIQPIGKDDFFLETETGGFWEEGMANSIAKINALQGVRIVGTTSFPCLMYDLKLEKHVFMQNFHTAVRVAQKLEREFGIEIKQVNISPNAMSSTVKMIAETGGTHAEPGLSVSGANTAHALSGEGEVPASIFVTEISHILGEKAYAFGGGTSFPGSGFGILPNGKLWFGLDTAEMIALVGPDSTIAMSNRPTVRYPGMDPFNYYYTIYRGSSVISVGDTVLFGLCSNQVFVSRSYTAAVQGIGDNNPKLLGLFDSSGNLVDRDGGLLGVHATLDTLNKV